MERQSGLALSHEAIYGAICALPRGGLRREVIGWLRHAKSLRGCKPKGSERRAKLVGMANIEERLEEVEERLIPGQWGDDLFIGGNGSSAISTLVERTKRFFVYVRMPSGRADFTANTVAGALNAIPEPLRKTLTDDQGEEMVGHACLAEAPGMRIYFADPRSTWRRGANASDNALLRQYCPKEEILSGFDQVDLDTVADSL